MFGSRTRPGMRGGPPGLSLFDSRTRPGMRGPYLGDYIAVGDVPPAAVASSTIAAMGLAVVGLVWWFNRKDRRH